MRRDLSFLTDHAAVHAAIEKLPLDEMMAQAARITREAHGSRVTYSRNVFIPLTKLCRDVCHYCTFAKAPRDLGRPYLSAEQVLEIARAGERSGCSEALFTLGDRPEARYRTAQAALDDAGCTSTLELVAQMAALVHDETSLLPHINAGILGLADYEALRPHSVSMGMMLETVADLSQRGMAHHGSPDKVPAVRLKAIEDAGRAAVPFTTGLLIGIGETMADRIDGLLAIRDLHAKYGHIQEVIIQNFRAKPGTRMADAIEPSLADHLRTIAAARLILPPEMTIQAPPNLHDTSSLPLLLEAGVNDWGGVSPSTIDHVNPEAPWPHVASLAEATRAAGGQLCERLPIAPSFAKQPEKWLDPSIASKVLHRIDARGLPREDAWFAGAQTPVPTLPDRPYLDVTSETNAVLRKVEKGSALETADIVRLFEADGADYEATVKLADHLRQEMIGGDVTFVVNRNINYTNICSFKCGFCGFSKGSTRAERGPAYRLDNEEIGRRAVEAQARGATEVCLQGGIHPAYDGNTYLDIVRAVRRAAPSLHIHAFSPLEITHGARTLGLDLPEYLTALREAGLASLPGTAAEILDDEVRAKICPDKIDTAGWLKVLETAHSVGLPTTSTIMFGHADDYTHWAQHLLRLRVLQERTGGITEFVPLPFVHMEAPNWRRGQVRSGPTFREAILMHAIARIVLHPVIPNIQVSWVKMGSEGAARALEAGCNDLGGVLMDESITRSSGGTHGQMFGPAEMAATAALAGRRIRQRTTVYGTIDARELEYA